MSPREIQFGADDRLLTVLTSDGVGIWDVASAEKRVDLTALPSVSVKFVSDGSMLSWGPLGLLRWPVTQSSKDSPIQIGPPGMLLDLRVKQAGIDATPDGRVVMAPVPHSSVAAYARVNGPAERTVQLGPQPDVRHAAVSPDGRWAATVTHIGGTRGDVGVGVWEIETGAAGGGLAGAEPQPSAVQSRRPIARHRHVWVPGLVGRVVATEEYDRHPGQVLRLQPRRPHPGPQRR